MTVQPADTAPPPRPPAVQETLAQQALRAAELLILERAAVRAVAWPLRMQLVAIRRAAVKAWIGQFGSTAAPGDPIRAAAIAAELRGRIARIDTGSTAAAADYAARALALGVGQEIRATGAELKPADVPAVLNATTARIAAGLEDAVREQLTDAENALGQAATGDFATVDAALGKARRAVSVAERNTVTAVHGAANAGRTAVTDTLGADTLILAEPDCCTTCAGLAGRTAPAGQPFDTKLASTYTDKPHLWPAGPLMHPPWHPNCRCEACTYLGPAPGAPGPSLPEALQREARRAVLKGWSLPTESNAERIRAARKALARNPAVPKAVLAYSRRAVSAGRFPTRDAPHRTRAKTKTKP